MRAQLQHHCDKFAQVRDKRQILEKYRTKTAEWAAAPAQDSAEIIKHAFHVSSWATFVEEDLGPVLDLLAFMLRSRGRTLPVPRLRLALRHVHDRLVPPDEKGADKELWEGVEEVKADMLSEIKRSPDCSGADKERWEGLEDVKADVLSEIERALDCSGQSTFGGNTAGAPRQRPAPRGTWGRTDVAFVRRVLRGRPLPPGCSIHWDGHPKRMRWYGSAPGGVQGTNATRRMYTDEDAVIHVYEALWRWHNENHAGA